MDKFSWTIYKCWNATKIFKANFFQRVQRLLNISFYMSLSKYEFCFDCCSFGSSMWLPVFTKHIYECSTSLFPLESVFAGGHVDEKYSIVTCFQFNSVWTIILDPDNTPTVRNRWGGGGRADTLLDRQLLRTLSQCETAKEWSGMWRKPQILFKLILTGTFFSYFKKTAFTEGVWYIC